MLDTMASSNSHKNEVSFLTKSGDLKVWRDGPAFSMAFPCNKPETVELQNIVTSPKALLHAMFGDDVPAIERVLFSKNTKKVVIQLVARGTEPLKPLNPDIKVLIPFLFRAFML